MDLISLASQCQWDYGMANDELIVIRTIIFGARSDEYFVPNVEYMPFETFIGEEFILLESCEQKIESKNRMVFLAVDKPDVGCWAM